MSTSALDTSTGTDPTSAEPPRALPPVLGKLVSGTFWMALRTPLQAVLAFWSIPLLIGAFGEGRYAAYTFAWGFGFFQFLLEFGMSSALQRQVTDRWTRGDRSGVDRSISCGIAFYAVMALVQAAALLAVAYLALPETEFAGRPYRLIVQLLWLQALTAPCYGMTVVVSSVLQAARRYEVIPRFELLIVALRFGVLAGGIASGASLIAIVASQTVVQVALGLGPATWVMIRELGYVPRLARVKLSDFRALAGISASMFMIQLSVVLADKIDTTVLGFVLDNPEEAVAAYGVVSKPFLQVRQMGWMLAFFVMPAVTSLAAAGDRAGIDRVKYDGARLHAAAVLPVGLLAAVYAAPFLELWVGDVFAGRIPELARLLRLFLIATVPLLVSVHVQMATGLGKVRVVAIAALVGALINFPLSYVLTLRLGVSGVIWGTVLTTLVSNWLVPGAYTFRLLEMSLGTYLRRTLLAPMVGGAALLATSWALNASGFSADPRGGALFARMLPMVIHLSVGLLAFAAGYLAVPTGRADLLLLLAKFRRRGEAS